MINTDAENCATCGAKAETGYNGDDFAMNIKRARCSNPGCEQHRELAFRGDAMDLNSILTVDEWNDEQREARP